MVLAIELRRRGIEHLHNHFANSGATVGLLASRQLGIGWSFTIHGISEFDYPAGLLLGAKVAAARFVACVSYFGRAQAYRLVESRDWHKLSIVRCGLALGELPPGEPATGPGLRLILVGRLSPEKGIGGLLEALALLPEAERPRLAIVGDGPMRAELDARVEQLGLGDGVTFLGRLPEAETLAEIARSDALVLPSFMEGLPIVLMEAMALGKPVIATRVAGIPELVTDGETGLLFTPSDWTELAAKISALTNDKELWQRLGAAGPRRIAEQFDVRRSAEAIRRLFHQAVPSAATASEHRTAPGSGTWAASTAGKAAAGSKPQD
jgi:glycosyltransferase involved in cell wall biosynthesis